VCIDRKRRVEEPGVANLQERIFAAAKRRLPESVRVSLRRVRYRLDPLSALGPADRARAEASPELRRFVNLVGPAAGGASFEHVERCRRAFVNLLRSDALREVVDYELAALDPARTNALLDFSRTLPILGGPGYVLEAVFVSAEEDGAITEIAQHTLVGAIGAEPVVVEKFAANGDPHWLAVDPELAVHRIVAHPLRPRTAILLERGDICRVTSEEPNVLLVLRLGATAPLRRHYHGKTLRAAYLTPTDMSWKRVREALGIIEALGDPELLDRVLPLTRHESPHLRWAALRTIYLVAPERGRGLLERALDDPHVQLAAAARTLLAGAPVAPHDDPEVSIAWH
jgi:hypothetical protein